jgi:hypothetical protein
VSAITETEPGGEMVCIVAFSARPRDPDRPSPLGARREFQVGEHVRFVASFYKNSPEDNPTGSMAIFEPLDSEDQVRYAATQNDFVSLDCWAGLERHFRTILESKDGGRGKTRSSRPTGSKSPRVHP